MADLLSGFLNLKDVLNQRVNAGGTTLIETVNTAYETSIREHNATLAFLFSLFVTRLTKAQLRYKSPVAARLQSLDENGRAMPVKMAGYYTVGFPIKRAGIALGMNGRVMRAKMTVQDANDNLALMLSADNHWLRDQILAAVFTEDQYTFSDKDAGDLTILPIANGDSQVYLVRAGNEAGTTANHLRAQATLDDSNAPFATIAADLRKRPENQSGRVVTLIPANLQATVEGLTAFIPKQDTDIRPGSASDVLVGSEPGGIPGEFIGKISNNYVFVWDALPDNYMVSVSTAGDRAIAMREYAEAELQGFSAWADRSDAPYFERQFDRFAGFAAYNRVNIIVTLIGAASYNPPTGLAQPLA
jgi:hypothetical protein